MALGAKAPFILILQLTREEKVTFMANVSPDLLRVFKSRVLGCKQMLPSKEVVA
jgi:hypothetical protein